MRRRGLHCQAPSANAETQIAAYLAIALTMTFGCFPGFAKWGAKSSEESQPGD